MFYCMLCTSVVDIIDLIRSKGQGRKGHEDPCEALPMIFKIKIKIQIIIKTRLNLKDAKN